MTVTTETVYLWTPSSFVVRSRFRSLTSFFILLLLLLSSPLADQASLSFMIRVCRRDGSYDRRLFSSPQQKGVSLPKRRREERMMMRSESMWSRSGTYRSAGPVIMWSRGKREWVFALHNDRSAWREKSVSFATTFDDYPSLINWRPVLGRHDHVFVRQAFVWVWNAGSHFVCVTEWVTDKIDRKSQPLSQYETREKRRDIWKGRMDGVRRDHQTVMKIVRQLRFPLPACKMRERFNARSMDSSFSTSGILIAVPFHTDTNTVFHKNAQFILSDCPSTHPVSLSLLSFCVSNVYVRVWVPSWPSLFPFFLSLFPHCYWHSLAFFSKGRKRIKYMREGGETGSPVAAACNVITSLSTDASH